jgi:hypothetical protein
MREPGLETLGWSQAPDGLDECVLLLAGKLGFHRHSVARLPPSK